MQFTTIGPALVLALALQIHSTQAIAQGPFALHEGQRLITHFTNEFGRDADATTTIASVSSSMIQLSYSSSRGLNVGRSISVSDRQTADAYVLGFAPRMPEFIPNSTSLGISARVLETLRSTGAASLTLIHSAQLERIDCSLRADEIDIKIPMIIEDRVASIPAVKARIQCEADGQRGRGELIIANDVNNPVLIESFLHFSWEERPRTERITRVVAGPGLHRDMVHSLRTLGTYDIYGLHFNFDESSLRPDTAQLVGEIAQMLKENPSWIIRIAGHTDSVGGDEYNQRLSTARAESVRRALIEEGIDSARVAAVGYGASRPISGNDSLVGRAMNRRVEFRRLDR
ncbi:MAG: OmpA family protein [Hyphomicrobiaceae bacterium]